MNPLLEGMFDEDWRIRESSVSLLGELLYLIGDTKAVGIADADADDDDGGLTTGGSSGRVIVTIRMHIGDAPADHVLASLYIARSDNSSTVRQVALQVWKSVVSNTPRTLREVMPSLVELLIQKLSSDSIDQRAVAGRALGELVRKLGDAVLPLVVPYLQRGLDSDDDELRQGVCLGLSEILRAASGKQIEAYVDTLVPALQQALCDDSDHVQALAAKAFHALIKAIGNQAIESVVPALLESIEEEYDPSDSDTISSAMQGLQRIVEVKPRDLLEYLLPKLMKGPYSSFSASTLGAVCLCASSSLHYYLSSLVPSLVSELILAEEAMSSSSGAGTADDEDAVDSAKATFDAVVKCACNVMSAVSTQGVNFLVGELGKEIENESNALRRKWGSLLTSYFFANCKSDYDEYVPVLLKYLLGRCADNEVFVHQAVVTAISALSGAVPIDELVKHVGFIRSCINLTASDAKHRTGRVDLTDSDGELILPIFKVTKSLEPILPIFIHAIMHGSEETRESAAQGIGEIMQMTDAAVLKPFLVKTTGPLIRILGEKFPSSLKFALLEVSYHHPVDLLIHLT
jgi:HEAT repeat protein